MKTCPAPDLVLTLEGRLDAVTAPQLDRQLAELPDGARQVIEIDLTNVVYIASSGLRVLLVAHRRQQQGGGCLRLRGANAKVWAVMQLCGFDQILDVRPIEPPPADAAPDSGAC
ncbi:MAG: STAS domain-containing protein [Chloroflexi bacterium]|nr:STAS domain-containing protein [Chloroflexota bacterium]